MPPTGGGSGGGYADIATSSDISDSEDITSPCRPPPAEAPRRWGAAAEAQNIWRLLSRAGCSTARPAFAPTAHTCSGAVFLRRQSGRTKPAGRASARRLR